MSNLSADLLKEFADEIGKEEKQESIVQVYGTVSSVSGTGENTVIYVVVDGTSSSTPVRTVVDGTAVKEGDRVLIMFQGRTATIVGNYTTPSSNGDPDARKVAENYLYYEKGGPLGLILSENASDPNIGRNVQIVGNGIFLRDGTTDLGYFMVDNSGNVSVEIGNASSNNAFVDKNGFYIRQGTENLASFTKNGLDLSDGSYFHNNSIRLGSLFKMYIDNKSIIIEGNNNSYNTVIGSYMDGDNPSFTNYNTSDGRSIINNECDEYMISSTYLDIYSKYISLNGSDSFIIAADEISLSNSEGSNIQYNHNGTYRNLIKCIGAYGIEKNADPTYMIKIGNSNLSGLSIYAGTGSHLDLHNKVRIYNAPETTDSEGNCRLTYSSSSGYDGTIKRSTGSSRKWKNSITTNIKEDLDPKKIYDIEVVQFKFNNDYLSKDSANYNKDVIGFIAEQIHDIYPIGCCYADNGDIIDWNSKYLIPAMLYLIQDQHKEIEKLKSILEVK